MKSDRPATFGTERTSRSLAPARPLPSAPPRKPSRGPFECLRHDARSATHTLNGFLDLLVSGALGAISPEQEQSIGHLFEASQRMSELLDTAIDLAQQGGGPAAPELSSGRLSSVTRELLRSMARDHSELCLETELSLEDEQLTQLEPGAFATSVRALILVLFENTRAPLRVSLSQTDLHTTLAIQACLDEPTLHDESVTQSLRAQVALSSDLDALAHELRNRDYLRLKRCEALLERQRGRLLVAPNLTRARLMLPVQRAER